MPSIRVGFGSDFVIKNQRVGVGTADPQVTLDVRGSIKGDFNVSGASSLSVYGGFAAQKQNVTLSSTIGFSTSGVGTFVQVTESETGFLSLVGEYNTVSEDIIVDEGKIFQVSTGSTVSVGTLESISIQSHFNVPNGGSNDRPDQPTEGMVRFNDDLNTLEFYNGIEWRQFTVSGASGRGLWGGGYNTGLSSNLQSIEYVTIATLGNGVDFGSLSQKNTQFSACSSETRALFGGGTGAVVLNTIDYITIASGGNVADFGDFYANAQSRNPGAVSSSTRGVWAGGANAVPGPSVQINIIQYVQISTIGNSIDFGDLTSARRVRDYRCSSSTRGVFGSGTPGTGFTKTMDFVTISSTGNAVAFGDMVFSGGYGGGCSNSTRGIFAGSATPTAINTMQYITIASTGNATQFGDLTLARQVGGSCSSSTRAVFGGGDTSTEVNVIDYVSILSLGNAIDFGDLSFNRGRCTACSDSHGGLGGF